MRITLLGDSIRQQYAPRVIELLGERFEVFQPSENCRFAKHTLRGLFDWANGMEGSEIVHWNNGHWDICDLYGDGSFTSEQEYVENMLRIAELLKKRHKKIIFATTTPVRDANKYQKNARTDRYNAVIVPELEKRGIIINDLNAILRNDIDKYICEDNIHLTEAGIELCALQTAKYIVAAQDRLSDTEKSDLPAWGSFGDGAPILI